MEVEARESLTVKFDGVNFSVGWPGQENDFSITSDLELKTDSENYTFDVVPLARKGLTESLILDVKVKREGKKSDRVGWVIPANALDSRSHDLVGEEYFLRYAYVAIREVLATHQDLFRNDILDMSARGITEAAFSDLFHDNVCFLIVCRELVSPDQNFELSRLLPTLVSLGFVPLEVVAPDSIEWECGNLEDGQRTITIRPTNEGLTNPKLTAKLFAIAAGINGSAVTQFFYLYQVVEYLLEEILHGLLNTMGQRISDSISAAEFLTLRDLLEGLSAKLSEKERLQVLVRSAQIGSTDLDDLVSASNGFLRVVSQEERSGIGALYQVRNFIVHQARNMPAGSDSHLDAVVTALARFLPLVLHRFELPGQN